MQVESVNDLGRHDIDPAVGHLNRLALEIQLEMFCIPQDMRMDFFRKGDEGRRAVMQVRNRSV